MRAGLEKPTGVVVAFLRVPGRYLLAACVVALFGVAVAISHQSYGVQPDLLAYLSAQRAFLSRLDPYALSNLFASQREIEPGFNSPMPVWNPPLFFVSYGWIFMGEPITAAVLLSLVRALAVMLCVIVGLSVEGRRSVPSFAVLFAVVTAVPIASEVIAGQLSSMVAASFALSYLLFRRGFFFWSGVALGLTAIKPHVALFPSLFLVAWAVRDRRFKLFLGSGVVLALGGALAELLCPGVHRHWISTPQGAVPYFGAGLGSFFRAIFPVCSSGVVMLLVSFVGVLLLLALHWRWRSARFSDAEMMVWFTANPFFSPYGFTFDHAILLVPLVYHLCALEARKPKYALQAAALLFLGSWGLVIFSDAMSLGPYRVQWIVFAVWSAILIAMNQLLFTGQPSRAPAPAALS